MCSPHLTHTISLPPSLSLVWAFQSARLLSVLCTLISGFRVCKCTHTYFHTHDRLYTHTHMLSHTKTYTSTLSRLRPFSLSFRLLHQHANVQSCVPFRASHTLIIGFRVHTHTHTHTHTRTHTHTHPSCICCDPARTNKRYSFTAKH